MNTREQEIKKALAELPDNIQRAVASFDWDEELLELSKTLGIQIDTINIFKNQTMLVVVGLERATNYHDNLVKSMDISSDLADRLVQEANDRIFSVLQEKAFSREENRDLEHTQLAQDLKTEGVELLDEDGEYKKEDPYLEPIEEEVSQEAEEEIEPKKDEVSPEPPQYQEEIKEEDLQGVFKHRTPNTAHNTQERVKEPEQNLLEKQVFEQPFISKGDTVNAEVKDEKVFENIKRQLSQNI